MRGTRAIIRSSELLATLCFSAHAYTFCYLHALGCGDVIVSTTSIVIALRRHVVGIR